MTGAGPGNCLPCPRFALVRIEIGDGIPIGASPAEHPATDIMGGKCTRSSGRFRRGPSYST
jgi:hypothetical protein